MKCLLTYREDIADDLCTRIDDENVIIALLALGIEPVALYTTDRFLAMSFVNTEFLPEPFGEIEGAISGVLDGPLIPYRKYIEAKRKWKTILSTFRPRVYKS